jgi:hypothetical protein
LAVAATELAAVAAGPSKAGHTTSGARHQQQPQQQPRQAVCMSYAQFALVAVRNQRLAAALLHRGVNMLCHSPCADLLSCCHRTLAGNAFSGSFPAAEFNAMTKLNSL